MPSQDAQKQGLSPVGEVNPFPSPSAETSMAIKEDETEDNVTEDNATTSQTAAEGDITTEITTSKFTI